MSDVEAKAIPQATLAKRKPEFSPGSFSPATPKRERRVVPVLITVIVTALAVWLGWAMWNVFMEGPWTRDGTVRAYVVTVAPEVAGRIVLHTNSYWRE